MIDYFYDTTANSSNELNSNYLAKGCHAVAFVVNYVGNTTDIKHIIKFSLLNKKKSKKNIEHWHDYYYNVSYIKYKRIFGTAFCNLFYYGDTITKDNEISNNASLERKTKGEFYRKSQNGYIGYEIYEYYDGRLRSNIDKLYVLGKLISLIMYSTNIKQTKQRESIYIFDYKYANIAFDRNKNIIIIDNDQRLFRFYYRDNKTIFGQELNFSIFSSTCVKKNMYLLMELNNPVVVNKLYSDAKKISTRFHDDDDRNFIIKTYKIFSQKLLNTRNLLPIQEFYNTFKDDLYSYAATDYNLYYDKFNLHSLVDILFHLFFKVNGINIIPDKDGKPQEVKTTFKLFNLAFANSIGFGKNKITIPQYRGVIPDKVTVVDIFSCFGNLNNIYLLKKMIYGDFNSINNQYENPVYDINDDVKDISELYQFLNYIIFDNVLERGLFAPDYERSFPLPIILECVYSFYLKLQIIFNVEFNSVFGTYLKSIFDLHKHNIDSNIGTDYVKQFLNGNYQELFSDEFAFANIFKYIGPDVISFCQDNGLLERDITIFNLSYKKICLISTIEQQMNRWQYRSIENLLIPPTNPTLEENLYRYKLEGSTEILSCLKWERIGDTDQFRETPEYILIKSNNTHTEYKSEEQLYLDNIPIRRYIALIVKCIRNGEQLTPEILGDLESVHTEYINDRSSIKPLSPLSESHEYNNDIKEDNYIKDLLPPIKLCSIHTTETIGRNKWMINLKDCNQIEYIEQQIPPKPSIPKLNWGTVNLIPKKKIRSPYSITTNRNTDERDERSAKKEFSSQRKIEREKKSRLLNPFGLVESYEYKYLKYMNKYLTLKALLKSQ